MLAVAHALATAFPTLPGDSAPTEHGWSNVTLELDEDLGVTGSAPVTAWADQSGLGHNLAEGAAGAGPALTADGVEGDGIADWMVATGETLDTFFSPSAWSLALTVTPKAASVNYGFVAPYQYHSIALSIGGYWTLFVAGDPEDAGRLVIGVGQYDGAHRVLATLAFADGDEHIFQARYGSAVLEIRLDAGPWVGRSCGNIQVLTDSTRFYTSQTAANVYAAVALRDVLFSDVRQDDAAMDQARDYLKSKRSITYPSPPHAAISAGSGNGGAVDGTNVYTIHQAQRSLTRYRTSDAAYLASALMGDPELQSTGPEGLAIAGGYAYVGWWSTPARITTHELATMRHVHTLSLSAGENNVAGLAVSGSILAVGLGSGHAVKVSIATPSAPSRVASIFLASNFIEVGAATGGKWFFPGQSNPARVYKVDETAWTLDDSVALSAGINAQQTAIGSDGKVYVALRNTTTGLARLTAALVEEATLNVGSAQGCNAIVRIGSTLYASRAESAIIRVPEATFTVTGTVSVGDANGGETLATDGTSLYMTGLDGGTRVLKKIDLGAF